MTAATQAIPDDDLIISLRGISKGFGAVQALDDVSLDIYKGEVVAIVGDNGAGKSTLVKILAGVHHPTSGSIKFRGREVTLADPAAAVRTREGRAFFTSDLYFNALLRNTISITMLLSMMPL